MIKTHKEIGAEIKRIRKSFGISQMKLAEKVGVSFQQIQKYEKGVNKISVEMLQRIAMALKVPVTTFFSKGNNHISEPVLKYSSGRKKLINGDFLSLSSDEITLINLFREIENKNIREGLIERDSRDKKTRRINIYSVVSVFRRAGTGNLTSLVIFVKNKT